MTTLSIMLPEELRAIIKERVASGRFSNQSEYVGSLIRQDQRRLTRDEFEKKLLLRLEGGTVAMDADDWKEIRQEFLRQVQPASKSRRNGTRTRHPRK